MQARLAQEVAEQLRTLIIETPLNVGDRLPPENKLMDRYGVSRSTIREAVKLLQAENIVDVRHGRGSFVADNTGLSRDPLGLSFADRSRLLPELMEVRLMLEPNISALAAQRRAPEDLARMHEALELMKRAASGGEDYHAYDYQFHIAVAQSTHNSVLERIFPVIFEAVERGYAQTAHIQGSFARALNFHTQILSAIESQDSEEALRVARLHIQQTLRDIAQQEKGEKS